MGERGEHHSPAGANTNINRMARSGPRLSGITFVEGDSGFDVDAWRHPTAALNRSLDTFIALITPAIRNADIDAYHLTAINVALGYAGARSLPHRPLLSNPHIRRQGYTELFRQIGEMWAAPAGAQRRWFFGTLITDMGNALEYAPVFEINRVRRDFRKIIARTGLNALAFLEFQASTNIPQTGHGGTIMCHAHFIAYTDDPAFQLSAANTIARSGAVLSNWLGAPTSKIEAVPSVSVMRRRCYYLCKAPAKGSYLAPNDRKPTGYTTRSTDVSPTLALRLAETLSQIDYRTATFTTGTATALKGNWLRALAGWQRPRFDPGDHDVDAAFQALWNAKRNTVPRQPIDWRTTTALPPCPAWQNAMQTMIVKVVENRHRWRNS